MRVRVDGTDRAFSIAPGEDLLEVFQSHGEPIATACGGVATCGTCWVTVLEGGAALVPIKPQERVHLGDAANPTRLRLACQAQLRADIALADEGAIVVRIPPLDGGPPTPREDRPEGKGSETK